LRDYAADVDADYRTGRRFGMNNGLPFVAFCLSLLGALSVLGGFAFVLSAMDRSGANPRLTGLWRCLARCTWPQMMGEALKMSLLWLDKGVRSLFEEAAKNPLLNILFFGLIFIFIPLAASVNALRGGSADLFKAYLVMLAIVAVLGVTSQLSRDNALIGFINAVLALVAGVGLMLGAPLYTLLSFSERILHENISHGFMICLLIAPFYYVVAFSAMNYIEFFLGRDPAKDRSSPVLFARRFLAALPVAFVLVFLALLLGQVAVNQEIPIPSAQMLAVSVILSALSLPTTMCALSPVLSRSGITGSLPALLNGVISATGLAIALLYFSYYSSAAAITLAASLNVFFGLQPGAGGIFLGPDFWVMHVPLLPILGVLGVFLVGGLAKAIIWLPGLAGKPNLASAGLLGLVGVGLFVCGRLLV